MSKSDATATAVETPAATTAKVPWLRHQLPAVNGPEYHRFRKLHTITHQLMVTNLAVAALPVGSNHEAIRTWLCDRFDTDAIAAMPSGEGDTDRQLLQYLGQLTAKGWNRLTNAIMVGVSNKAV